MVIKTIAEDGKLYHANKLIEIPVVDSEKGVGNSGTFIIFAANVIVYYFKIMKT